MATNPMDLIERLRAMRVSGVDEDSQPKPKVLEEINLAGIVKHIQKLLASDNPKKVIVMTGAGISTAAGIPDFRSPGSGLYDNLQKYNLPTPQSIFDISYFPIHPKPFYHLAKEMYPGKFKPTLSHYFIKLLEDKKVLLRNYTQNIDTLERRAGLTDESMVEAHGGYNTAHCITCGAEYSDEFVRDKIFVDQLPLCTRDGCAKEPKEEGEAYKGLIKPDIVFFGESLPKKFGELAGKDMAECDLLIIMGTSLTVQPFASLAGRVQDNCPRLLINLEKVEASNPLMLLLGIGGDNFDFSETSYRDVFLKSTCDDGVRELAKLLGWEAELLKLYDDGHSRLDVEMKSVSSTGGDSGVEPTTPAVASNDKQ